MRSASLALTLLLTSIALAAEKPNIVLILSDDQGWADVGYHGGTIKTPALDRLAADGARLEQFYVQPVCSPTRAAYMTGRYPIRYGLQVSVIKPWEQFGLSLDERILPAVLKEAGYETAIVGKWHLGFYKPDYLPTRRGFDHQYGHYNGQIDYFTHFRDGGLDWHRQDKALDEEGYSTTLIGDEACRRIRERDKSKPLFLYVPFNAVHSPHQVPESYTAPYESMTGVRQTYAGMLAAMDEAIGKVQATLDAEKMTDNTLVIFSSDNGGPAPGKITDNGPLRGAKGSVYEGGVRVPATATWPGKIKAGSIVNEPLHAVDWFPTLVKLVGASPDQKLPLDGRDAWPTITAGAKSPHQEILLNAAPTGGALRVGDWKIVINGSRGVADEVEGAKKKKNAGPKVDSVELFNIAADPYEKNDLSTAEASKLAELRARYDAIAAEAVKPLATREPENFKAPKVWGEAE
jgi:arylsulfatase A-like enzyme